jgi:mycothiol synthase
LLAQHTMFGRGVARVLAAPDEPGRSAGEIQGWFRHPPATAHRRLWLTGGDAGAAWLSWRTAGTANARLMVRPGRRREGRGMRLLADLVACARSEGVRTVLGMCDDEESVRFLAARGGRPGHTFVRQSLAFDRPPRPDGRPGDGLVLRSWGSVPGELLASYAVARGAINDAPADEAEVREWTGERVRDLERAIAARGHETHVTVILDGDRVVAFTELRVSAERDAVAHTEETAVLRAYRGRGLARQVKAASLRGLAFRRPDVHRVVTTNEVTNAPMLAVNRRLGFVPVATRTQVRLDLAPIGR